METIFSSVIKELCYALEQAVKTIKPPLLKTPFLDFTTLRDDTSTLLLWTHSTIVAIMPERFDVNSKHFQDILLDINPDGVQNYSIRPNNFAYIESGDSLVCLPNTLDIKSRSPETIAHEDWIYWIGMRHYTWKTAWELDRSLYVILNLVISHLKHKRTEKYRDVYAVNALINNLMLILDAHKPRNMTLVYYVIYFLEKMNDSWRTDEILQGAYSKMDALRQLITQLDEIEEGRRARRLELFLAFLGVFALGSLILDFFGAMSFTSQVPDIVVASLALGIPVAFLIIAYYILHY